jgi:hypothetical protein
MIGVLVTFQYDDDFDRGHLEGVAQNARTTFEGMPGLRSKAFTIDESGRRAVNVYLWDSEEAARAFFDDALVELVTGLYGVPPSVAFLDVAAFVDNGTLATA